MEEQKGSHKLSAVMALDLVEERDSTIDIQEAQSVKSLKSLSLPPEVNSKMLYKDIVHIAWPSLVELTLTQLASMVDLMMVGQLGSWALTAVGLTTQPKFIFMTMFMAMNVGATAMVARYKGAGEPQKANCILHQAMLLTIILSLIASVLGFVFSEPLVRLMTQGAISDESLKGAVDYLQIQMAGLLFLALTSTATAVLRGVGNSRTAMTYNLIANLVNVVLNYLLIYGHFGFPRMEVAGASLATVIGQTVAFVLAMYALMGRKGYLRLRFKNIWQVNKEDIKSITKIGFPAMVEQFIMRTGMTIYAMTVITLGDVAFATHQVCMNINAMSFMIGQGFAVSATSLVGQSLGKRRSDMAQFYASRTQRIGVSISVFLGIIFFFFGRQIVGLYADGDDPAVIAAIIEQGGDIMRVLAFTLPLSSTQFIFAGALRGAGDTKATAFISFCTILLVRPIIAIIAINVLNWGLWGAWIALFADQVIRSGLVYLRYQSGKWKTAVHVA